MQCGAPFNAAKVFVGWDAVEVTHGSFF